MKKIVFKTVTQTANDRWETSMQMSASFSGGTRTTGTTPLERKDRMFARMRRWIRRINYTTKIRSNPILIEIPASFLKETARILKFKWKYRRFQVAKAILRKKNMGSITITGFFN